MGVGSLFIGQQDELRSGDTKASHSLRETRKLLESEGLEDSGVEFDSRDEVGLGDLEENVCDRHLDEREVVD
jgi:hypothetical protein